MNVELLIHAIVRQTTVMIAQLATANGIRAPLSHVANQVFADLVDELDRQGVSRKVSADMFGLGLRTYRRKVQRLAESSTMRGRSLWETVLGYIRENKSVSRGQVLQRFSSDDEAQVKAVLHDLCESQLIFASGSPNQLKYEEAEITDPAAPNTVKKAEIDEELLVALMYREGALSLDEIARMLQIEASEVEKKLTSLVADGRIQCRLEEGEKKYLAEALLIPLGAPKGWEGAVFDHYKALVSTVLARLGQHKPSAPVDQLGGSTYTFAVWPGHPLEEEVLGTLARLRASLGELRGRVSDHNDASGEIPNPYSNVVVYVGQNVKEEEHVGEA